MEKDMAVKIDREKCIKCGTCINVCPMSVYKENEEGGPTPDNSKCVNCGLCINMCPTGAISFEDDNED